jgi:exosortase
MASNSFRHLAFAVLIAASLLLFSKSLAALISYAWSEDSSSHILLIPIISFYFGWLARKRIFASSRSSVLPGLAMTLSGAILFFVSGSEHLHLRGNEPLSLSALSTVIVWTGAFLFCYGSRALRAAMFPFLFLFLMIPIPEPVLNRIIHVLQQGSTEVTCLIFKAVQVPVFRQGFVLSVPGVTIEVAKECSSIRSSIALLITCILAAHLYLRTSWKALFFVLLSLPMSVVKNGIRIVTLTLLSLYVNPDFLRGNLHRDGGFVFFLLALLMLSPVFVALERSDRPSLSSIDSDSSRSEALADGRAKGSAT